MPDASGPRIAAVETTTVSARAKAALRVRGQRVVHDASTFTLVRVVTDDGVEGFGEVSATAAWSGEDAVTATHFVRDVLGPGLVGKPLAPIEAHATEFDRILRGNWFTKAGVSTALWDALGRSRGVAVAELLGGPYRREVPVKISLERRRRRPAGRIRGRRRPRLPVLQGQGRPRSRGGRGAARAGARAGRRRRVARRGRERRLAVAGRARDGPRLAESGIAFIEQPVQADDLEGLRDVRALGVPLIADESVYSPADVRRIGRLGAADIVSIYVGKSSGLERAVESARLAAELGLDVVIGANGEMGIGAAAQLHVACACERISEIPHGIIGHHFYEEDTTLAVPLEIDGVVARLPDGPGLGVEPSDEVRQGFSS